MTFTWSLQPDMTILCPIALLLTNVSVVLVCDSSGKDVISLQMYRACFIV